MDQTSYETALLSIFLLPLAGALINGLLGRKADRPLVGAVAVGSVAMAFALSVLCAVHVLRGGERITTDLYTWLGVGAMPVQVRFVLDPLSAIMALVITGVGTLIHVFSLGYMREEKSWARYFAYLNLFTASMLLLVFASNLPLLFVGWEGVGVCSYLLIGFWFEEGAYADAAKKAFIVNRIGDFGVLVGMFVLAGVATSFEMSAINAAASGGGMLVPIGAGTAISTATVGAMLLFLGCAGKSAQLPLYVWLPDAMAGPTPVSALIHAATMVTAGVYLCCRLSSVFLASPETMAVIAIVGAATALIGAVTAVRKHDLKKILAYSTVSQLGFMFAAIGVGAFTAGIFHVVTHAFFKACLFLGAGSIMHAVHAHGDADVRFLGGLGAKMPKTRATFLISVLAIAGLPPTAGFFSKDEILAGAARAGLYGATTWQVAVAWAVLAVLTVCAVLTAFYMGRAYALAFRGEYRGAGHYADEPHESEPVLTVPLIILAVFALTIGFVGIPHWAGPNLIGHALEGTVHDAEFAHGSELPSFIALAVGVLAAAFGLLGAHVRYTGTVPASEAATESERAGGHPAPDVPFIDRFYDRVVVTPLRGLADYVAAIDVYFVDVILVKAPALVVALKSKLAVRMQDGVVHTYALAMAVGVAMLVGFYSYPVMDVEARTVGPNVTLTTPRGLGYHYAWDLDADGTVEASGDDANQAHFRVDRRNFVDVEVIAVSQPNGIESTLRLSRTPRELVEAEIPTRDDQPYAPMVHLENRALHIRPNGAPIELNGRPTPAGNTVVASGGARVRIGKIMILVVPVIRVALEVRTVLGQEVRRVLDVPIRQESTRQDIPIAGREALEVTP